MRNKSNLLLASLLCLLMAGVAGASSPPWLGDGVYTFDDSDPYFHENGIYDTATVNITGGSFGVLYAWGESTVNMTSGTATTGIGARDNSIVNLYGGEILFLGVASTATVNMFVDNYEFNPDSYVDYDQITGTWLNDNGSFEMCLYTRALSEKTDAQHFLTDSM